jgi:hypothetical protein
MFKKEVSDCLKYYVYRLIDPRTGETFYVGKGKDNRVFQHVRGETGIEGDDDLTEKIQRIRDIRLSGFEVAHVIHRHGLDEDTAYEVESALIDAYPGITNVVDGHNADTRGTMHANQIIERYEAETADFQHKLIVISINKSALDQVSIYEATRCAWKIDPKKAEKFEFVLAVQQGLIIGVFKPEKWLPATPKNFPNNLIKRDGRWGFEGTEAPDKIKNLYLRKRIPEDFRKKGAANPIRYV